MLDDAVISAYERLPITVVGDGRATIRRLFARKQREFERGGRDTMLDADDLELTLHLREQRLSWDSVLRRVGPHRCDRTRTCRRAGMRSRRSIRCTPAL